MKMLKNLLKVIMAVLICVSCFACTDNGGKEPESELTPAELSEKAMENFIRKLDVGNYVVTGGQKAEVNVVSPEQVYINYPQYGGILSYVFMTLKGETFASEVYDDDKISDVSFVSNITSPPSDIIFLRIFLTVVFSISVPICGFAR